MRINRLIVIMTVLTLAALLCSCSENSAEMQDGYYTARASSFDSNGWKEYITIYVSNNKILTVEYDACDASGLARSWDINFMRTMRRETGTYPNEFTRSYSIALINWQDPAEVDVIAGAEASHASFKLLAEAAISQAKKGDTQVVLIDLSDIQNHMQLEG